jgi:predicted RNA-binding protein with PIN domain
MALVRILVDGYNLLGHIQQQGHFRYYQGIGLLHAWPELAPGKARHTAAARDELIHHLTLYRDAVGTPITVVFDGINNDIRLSTVESTREVEILYTRAGQTADQVIERVTYRLSSYGEVLAVTDDNAERDTVINLGGMASSCMNFIQSMENTFANLKDEIKLHNRREKSNFKQPPIN